MVDLTASMRLIFARDEEISKRDRGDPEFNELRLEMAEIGLRSFAPKQAYDFLTLSLPKED